MIYEAVFGGCCGIRILYGLGKSITAGLRNDESVKSVLDEVAGYDGKDVSMLLIALNQDQIPIYGAGLGALGYFPVVNEAWHPGHDSKITLYARVSYPNQSYGAENHKPVKKKSTRKLDF